MFFRTLVEGNIGTLAEECLEALRDNTAVFKRVSEARRATTSEKRKAAMAYRQKLKNEITKPPKMAEVPDLEEEKGPVCVICREGQLEKTVVFSKNFVVVTF